MAHRQGGEQDIWGRRVTPSACSPEEVYEARCERFARERDSLTRRWNRVANLRLAVAIVAVPCLVWGIAGWRVVRWAQPLLVLGVVLAGCFVGLVVHHRRLGRLRRRAEELWAINDEARKRLARAWDELPLRHSIHAEPDHPYAVDLDIFGRASLFHLLETAGTPPGEMTLSDWLRAPAPPETVRERQAAVAELAPLLDLRHEIAFRARLMDDAGRDLEPFLLWAEDDPRLIHRRRLLWGARLNVGVLWTLLIAQVAGVVPYPVWLLCALTNLLYLHLLARGAQATFRWLFVQERALGQYAELFKLLASASFHAPLLKRLQDGLTAEGLAAHRQIKRLKRRATFAVPFTAPLYWPIQALTLWDLHVLAALEGWQMTAGRRVRAWLSTLGEAEALAALAVLAHDNPAWAFPELDGEARLLDARDLGHPYLPRDVRVGNDVAVGPPGAFLLITGSNMSGKSTLLRAIGVNLVLAGAGGPVCASAFRSLPVALSTSMRVQDSLERGVSYFMAELYRLKQVVDGARSTRASGESRFFYLLDEILQGTNTAERQIAARRIIAYLVAQGALGAVSTHDLTLADDPAIAAAARPVHFTETIAEDGTGPTMSFDYKLRPGIATSTNALKLMQIVGLDLNDEPSGCP